MVSLTSYLEYLPILLLTLFFVAEAEMERHTINTTIQIIIAAVAITVFIILVRQIHVKRYVAILITVLLWIFLVYMKRQYITSKIV